MRRRKIKDIARIGCGIAVVGGFILLLGVIGADDVATANGVFTDVWELVKKLSVSLIMILAGVTGLNIL